MMLTLRPGDTVSHFKLLDHLGDGAMGPVFKAENLNTGRFLALKFLDVDQAQLSPDDAEATRERLRRTVKTLEQVEHPYLSQVYEAHQEEDRFFVAREFLEGLSLERRLKMQQPLDKKEICTVALCVVQALRYAWEQLAMIHGDLRLGNIVVDNEGRGKVVDLGIVKAVSDDSALPLSRNRNESLVRQMQTLALEQHIGADGLDQRADIFALGVILFELLTGDPPFPNDSILAQFRAKRRGAPEAMTPRDGVTVSGAFESTIREMMTPNRRDRLGDYGEIESVLAAELEAAGAKPPRPPRVRSEGAPPTELGSTNTNYGARVQQLVMDESGAVRTETTAFRVPSLRKKLEEAAGGWCRKVALTGSAAPPAFSELLRALTPGTLLAGCELGEMVGAGASSAVFRARETGGGAERAVKLMATPHRDAPAEFDAFCKRVTGLEYHSICRVYDCQWYRGCVCLVEDLLLVPSGKPMSLTQYQKSYKSAEGFLDERLVQDIALIVLDALAHAHKQGVVHGSVVPDSVLFRCKTAGETAWDVQMTLTDFGLKPAFSPPGELPEPPTMAYDQRLAASLIHYVLTGRRAVPNEQRPSSVRKHINELWDPILSKASRRDPDRRFASVDEMAGYVGSMEIKG